MPIDKNLWVIFPPFSLFISIFSGFVCPVWGEQRTSNTTGKGDLLGLFGVSLDGSELQSREIEASWNIELKIFVYFQWWNDESRLQMLYCWTERPPTGSVRQRRHAAAERAHYFHEIGWFAPFLARNGDYLEHKLGPKLLGVFPGGRLEEFIPSRVLTYEECRNPG